MQIVADSESDSFSCTEGIREKKTKRRTRTGRVRVSLLLVVSVMALLVLGISPPSGVVTASDASGDSNVSISIESMTSISVSPQEFSFENMQLTETNFSDVPALQLQIQNDGSTNVTDIYAHISTLTSEPENPLGSNDAQDYASGGFLWIRNQSSNWYHAGTLSWNRTENVGGKPPSMANELANSISFGYYQNATGNYLWELAANFSTGDPSERTGEWQVCDDTTVNSPVIRIKNSTDDEADRDMEDDTVEYILNEGRNAEWSETFATNGPLKNHYVAAFQDCTKLYIRRFDASPTFPLSGENRQYLVNTILTPGQEYTARVGASVPQGIPSGVTNQTVLTIHASSTE